MGFFKYFAYFILTMLAAFFVVGHVVLLMSGWYVGDPLGEAARLGAAMLLRTLTTPSGLTDGLASMLAYDTSRAAEMILSGRRILPWKVMSLCSFLFTSGLGYYLYSRKEQILDKPMAPAKNRDVKKDSAPVLASKGLISIGGTPFPKSIENRHIVAIGGTGSGKSQTIRKAIQVIEHRKDMALIIDNAGELMTRIRQKGDFVIAANDKRCWDWSPLAEMKCEADAERVAAAMVAKGQGNNSEWDEYARTLLLGILIILWRKHEDGELITNKVLATTIGQADGTALRALMDADNPAAGLLSEDNTGMLGSVFGVLSSKAKALAGLNPDVGFNGVSIDAWVKKNADLQNRSWLWVPVPARVFESASALASIVSGFYVNAVLSLKENEDRRCWFICDELGQYGAISGLTRALTLGRKYGLSCCHAFQTVAQLKAVYGDHGATVLLANYTNKVVYRCNDGATAKWASDEIGQSQIQRRNQSMSSGSSGQSSSSSEQVAIENTVLGSEIQNMADLYAYCYRADTNAWSRIKVPYVKMPGQREEDFEPREVIRMDRKVVEPVTETSADEEPISQPVAQEPEEAPVQISAAPAVPVAQTIGSSIEDDLDALWGKEE